MTNTQVVDVDLTQPGWQGTIFAVAGDIYSRFVQMNLFAAGQPYEPPSGVSCVIGWRRGANFGTYDQIAEPDGTSSTHQAWEISGNVLTIELNWQVTAKAGPVGLNVAMIGQDGSRLHTWELQCQVQPGAVADADDPTLPSESATQAAQRAEQAAQQAEDSAADLADAVARAEAAAQRAEAVAPEDGAVTSVNGKGGAVVLDSYDVGALPAPAFTAGITPGMIFSVQSVTDDGKIIVQAVDMPSYPGGFIEMATSTPVDERTANTLYGLIVADLSDDPQPATFNN